MKEEHGIMGWHGIGSQLSLLELLRMVARTVIEVKEAGIWNLDSNLSEEAPMPTSKPPSVYCGGNHGAGSCRYFQNLRVKEEYHKGKTDFFRCLASGHEGRTCTKARPCDNTRKAPVRYGYDKRADTSTHRVHHVAYHLCEVDEPTTLQGAMSSDHAAERKFATDSEYSSMIAGKQEVLSPGRKAIGFQNQNDLLIHQMDVETAFLCNGELGKLDEEIQMKHPEGYVKQGEEHLVCKLEKSLYGLKKTSRCWNKTFRECIEKIGFTPSSADSCSFVRKEDTLTIIEVYVDDLMIQARNISEMKRVKHSPMLQFMRQLRYYVGVCLVYEKENKQFQLHQG
ncbi:hypothetical protein ACROYT_G041940 [Oculina patagonica]